MVTGETNLPARVASGIDRLATCHCCGLLQQVPEVPPKSRAECGRCSTRLSIDRGAAGNRPTLALALAALAIYPVAITQPILRIQEFGHLQETSILDGTISLLSGGQWLVGSVVLLCSILLPVGKLVALVVLSVNRLMRRKHLAITYHIVEFTGRWGMLDVLLVAILVAVLKLGDLVEVSAGPAAAAFTLCVLFSLLASAWFDPHVLWREQPTSEVEA